MVYGYMITAVTFLGVGFILLLFGANTDVAFTEFVYKVAAGFLEPFRGIFPAHKISETGYFSTSALFAIMIYMLLALAMHSLIAYVTGKMVAHQSELDKLEKSVH
ncbi:YggT family protein [Candidatus Saccharibacteria bacterium]|nr:YggT family protein [Candidatus Saccharibacteria bacterium]